MQVLRLSATLALTIVLAACSGGTSSTMARPAPSFTSTPPSSASEGSAYNYTITATDPAGGTLSFALSGPQGSTLTGNTVSWTPSGTQSRVSNAFKIVATTSEGATAAQSWNVTPAGTIHGTLIDTRWTSTGPTNLPFDFTKVLSHPQALLLEADGTSLTIDGTGNSDGTFSIPHVPGGYYWLEEGGFAYWTSSSTVDLGSDIVGRPVATTQNPEMTTFAFNIDGLDPVITGDRFAFLTDWQVVSPIMNIAISSPSGSTSITASDTFTSNLDYSAAAVGFLMQYEPVSAGSITGLALGPELTVSPLALTSGTTNNITATLNPSPDNSFELSVKGSQWAPLFQNAGPGPATPNDAYISMSARPFAPATVLGGPLNLPLFVPSPTGAPQDFLVGFPRANTCSDAVMVNPQGITTFYAPMLADQDFGTLTYGDPFDQNMARVFSLCQTASVEVPVPGGGPPARFYFQDGVNTAIPNQPVAPLALPVQNPTINGVSFFTANSLSPSGLTLSWSPPAGTSPFAYKVLVLEWATLADGSMGFAGRGVYYTGKTSATLPALQAGQTYVFALTTEVDGRANVETSPRRSALPTASATVISAPITTN